MSKITLIVAGAVVALVGIYFLFPIESEGPTQFAEDDLLGLKQHFKNLDSVSVKTWE